MSNDKDTLTANQFSQLLEAIQRSKREIDASLEAKLADFCDEVRGSQEKAAESAACRAQREPFSFKKKGNQEQFRVTEEIDEALLQAEQELETMTTFSATTEEKLRRVEEHIVHGRKLIANRQKLIKLADHSDLGWAVVEEYTTDELAEDSNNKKRLDKAERSAEGKVVKRKKQNENRHRPYSGRRQSTFRPQLHQTATLFPSNPVFPTPIGPNPRRTLPVQFNPQPKVVGPCYQCGQIGHLRNACPRLNGGASNKAFSVVFPENFSYVVFYKAS